MIGSYSHRNLEYLSRCGPTLNQKQQSSPERVVSIHSSNRHINDAMGKRSSGRTRSHSPLLYRSDSDLPSQRLMSSTPAKKSGVLTNIRRRASTIFKWTAPAAGPSITTEEVETVHSLLLPGLGMFIFYVIHDALQEQMFRFDGFEYGWFMSMAEVFLMLILAVLTEGADLKYPPGGFRTWGANALIGLCVAGSHGFGNTALRYSTYPLKVSFRSCKLVPTMALGVCVTGRRHSVCEYIAAFIMCAGLMTVTLADVTTHVTMDVKGHGETTAYIGPLLLAISALLDSIVPNLQESIFTQTNARAVDTMFLSNHFMFVILTAITLISGELSTAWTYCVEHKQVFGILALQSTSAYFGLRCYLTIIKSHGSVGGVLLANARKVVTILVSFLLFSKPCKPMHLAGFAVIFVGVYLGVAAKRAKKHQGGWAKSPTSPLPQASISRSVSKSTISKSSVEPSPSSNSSVHSTLHNMSTERDH